ncbi:MAG: adenosine deaminase [Variovorax sp.]
MAPMIELEAFCHSIPKVELHCHLLGTVRHATFKALAHAARAPLADAEIDGFYIRGEKPVGVLKALRALDSHLLRTPDDLHRITYEYLEDAAAHNVRYAEFFWNPTGTVQKSGMRYLQAQEAIVRAINDAEADHGITGRLVPAIDREASPEAALEMVAWVRAHRCAEVVGIGIDYSEIDRPPELFADAYAAARAAGLKTTAHAGEFGMPWTNVRTAVEVLKVDRIDHGYTIVGAPDYARRCAEAGIVFTVVPTNSYYLRTLPPERWALDHPIRKMPGLGLRIHPNTDDPTLHLVTPTGAWQKMVEAFGFSIDDLRGFMHNGLDSAWIDDATRRQWRAAFSADFDRLRAMLSPHAVGTAAR